MHALYNLPFLLLGLFEIGEQHACGRGRGRGRERVSDAHPLRCLETGCRVLVLELKSDTISLLLLAYRHNSVPSHRHDAFVRRSLLMQCKPAHSI